jgi:hypothetical protein
LAWGTGAVNIDASRVPTSDKLGGGGETGSVAIQAGWRRQWMDDPKKIAEHADKITAHVVKAERLGRWPANVVHDGSDEVEAAFAQFGDRRSCNTPSNARPVGTVLRGSRAQGRIYPGENGSASRFFFCAKASKRERNGSQHPTIKPLKLVEWMCRLITPVGGMVLDPFAGTGTTGEAAANCGMNAILIEKEDEYVADMRRRLARFLAGSG